ncbi:MAG: hypothetical protein NTX61_14295 [Bacteroidetes bacterium]|nr:hypothetical protein [Bacteroidota bacterium]
MSSHEVQEEPLSHEELKYREHTQRGADFIKIDLFRSAREEFKAALQYKPGDKFATEKAIECQGFINRDRKKVLILVPIVLAIITLVILFNL